MSAFVPLLRHFVSESATPLPSPVAPIDVEAERAAAYRAGHDDAERACAARLAELEQRLAVAVPLLDEVARARREALDRSATDVGEMVIAFARKVVGDSLTVHPDALIGVVRAALDELPDEDEVWVRVAPDQVERVRSVVPEPHRDRVVAAPEVASGCVVQTRHVTIDATLDAAVAGIDAATQAWLAGRA